MAKPRIFVSSTYYDLRHIRASLETFIQSLGYEPVLSEKGEIAYTPDRPLDESCYREAGAADVLVLIIGGRYGAETSDSRTEHPRSFYERYDSITKGEYQSALDNNVPVYILVDAQVNAEYQTFQKNKDREGIIYAHVDSVNVFYLLEQILAQRRNNALSTFSRYTEIEDWLREQWAGFFRELLKRSTQSQQIASLSSQVTELSEINKTLRIYLENLMSNISPDDSRALIEKESARLQQVELENEVKNNGLIQFLIKNNNVPVNKLRDILISSKTLEDFLALIANYLKPIDAEFLSDVLGGDDTESQELLNRARDILDMPRFSFQEPHRRKRRVVAKPRAEPKAAE
jgi:hypothetical protein